MMASYTCPLCHKEIPRDLAVFLDHTNEHIIAKIKDRHPEWVAKDGTCNPCRDYYQKALKG